MRFNTKKAFGKGLHIRVEEAAKKYGIANVLFEIKCICSDSKGVYPAMVEKRLIELIRCKIGRYPTEEELTQVKMPPTIDGAPVPDNRLVKLYVYASLNYLPDLETVIFPVDARPDTYIDRVVVKYFQTNGITPFTDVKEPLFIKRHGGAERLSEPPAVEKSGLVIGEPEPMVELDPKEFNLSFNYIKSQCDIGSLDRLEAFKRMTTGPSTWDDRTSKRKTTETSIFSGNDFVVEYGRPYKLVMGNDRYIAVRGECGGLFFKEDGSVTLLETETRTLTKDTLWNDFDFQDILRTVVWYGYYPVLLQEIADLSASKEDAARRMLTAFNSTHLILLK